jgi:hypothetical protein
MTDVLRQAWEAAFRHVRPLLDANLPLAFGVVALWTTIGLVCGGVLGAGVFVVLRRGGALAARWRYGGFLRALSAVWLCLSVGTLGLLAGANEGVVRAMRRILEQPSVRAEYLGPLGELGADALCMLDAALRAAEQGTDLQTAGVSVSRGCEDGALDVLGMRARVGRAERRSVDAAIRLVRERVGLGRGSRTRELAEDLLEKLLKAVVQLAVGPGTRGLFAEIGLRDVRDMLDRLPAAAADRGGSGHLTRGDLSAHIVRFAVIPTAVRPVRGFARANQLGAALLALAAVAVPVVFFWVFRKLEAHGRAPTA